jgi:guanidinopropionase
MEKKDFYPLSGREFPRFSSHKTFFRLPISKLNEKYDVALFGTPFDGGTSYRPGSRFGPSKIRELSSLGRSYNWGREIDVFNKIKVADVGDCPTVPISIDKSYEKIQSFAEKVLNLDKKFISVGGDHSTTLPLLRAIKNKYKKNINLIHFDAHLDTYPAAWDCEYHHGSFLRHVVEEGLIPGHRVFQFGIRGPLASKEDLNFIKKNKLNVFTIDKIREKNLLSFCKTLPRFSDGVTYISFDIDCLDPAYAPGTGTPVPGGLTSYEVQKILRLLKIKNLVAADLVEVCPAYDPTEITSLLAVDIIFEMLTLMSQN